VVDSVVLCMHAWAGVELIDVHVWLPGNWLFFQIFLLVVLESLDALRTGFWLAGSVAKCSDLVLVSIRCMSLVWGSQV
jgi:hypothetical protein